MGTSTFKLIIPDKTYENPSYKQKNHYKNKSAIRNLLSYIFREETGGVRYGNTLNLGTGDIPTLADKIVQVQKFHGKNKGRRMYHYVLSYEGIPNQEDAKYLFAIAEKLTTTFFHNTQIAYAVHENTNHLHVHFAFSAVTLDGRKWNLRKQEFNYFKTNIENFASYMMAKRTLSLSDEIFCYEPSKHYFQNVNMVELI